jgi:uncharacterized protein (TIGR00375 family)
MRVIADLHIHSKYSRACSRDLVPENIALWADKKGIQVIGSGDFTHPAWRQELKETLTEDQPGLYRLRNGPAQARFMLTVELASIYKQGDKVRRIHNLVFAPNFAAAEKLVSILEARGANLKSDGRPIMGVPAPELMKLCKEADERMELVPAHAWTPHFGVFGSMSGFDSLEEAFGDQSRHIFAVETGLSSDPAMNWRVRDLDAISLISNSDAHSLRKIGREANVLELSEQEFSYGGIIAAIRERSPAKFLYTIEFFPEEGKYHLDGHRDHSFSCTPEETKTFGGICPVCGKKLLRGVLSRVDDLSVRKAGDKPAGAIPYRSVIPLEEVIAETLGVGVASKRVSEYYEKYVAQVPEFPILLDLALPELANLVGANLAESIMRVRQGKVSIEPGYDGVFGKIQIYSSQEKEKLRKKPAQPALF